MDEYGGEGSNIWSHNRIIRNPNKTPLGLLVSNADLFQSTGCKQGPKLLNNEFTFAGDDCVNIHNYFNVVMKVDATDARRVLLLDGVGEADLTGGGYPWHQELNTFSRVRIGDAIRLYDVHKMALHSTTSVA